jgi:hypothetical protein
MGPDGEDALFSFLQDKLKSWQSSLNSYKPLADTGDYPGKDEIADALILIKKLLACDSSYKFIEQFNSQKKALLDLADQFNDLQNFYEHQKPTWEKLHKAYSRFRLNQLELERDIQAGPALKRIKEILEAPIPYGIIKEAEDLITKVNNVNSGLVTEHRKQAYEKIKGYIGTLTKDIQTAQGNETLRSSCIKPLEALCNQIEIQNSLAHITQAEAEALKRYDASILLIEEYVKKEAEKTLGKGTGAGPKPTIKKQRIVEPAKMVKTPYIETLEEVNGFIKTLREELEEAISNDERVKIR